MTNSVVKYQTAPIGAVQSGSTLLASTLKFVSNVKHKWVKRSNFIYLIYRSSWVEPVAADDFSRHHFFVAFFLGALRAKTCFGDIYQDLWTALSSVYVLR